MPREVPLSQGMAAIVDDEDYERVSAHKWCVQRAEDGRCYALYSYHVRGQKSKSHMQMHRFIIDPPDDREVDHIDGDGLNNRRDNLRPATTAQNQWNAGLSASNTSGFKGVSTYAKGHCWQAGIRYHDTCIGLGHFNTPEDAARAYNAAARRLFGDYARLNDVADPTPMTDALAATALEHPLTVKQVSMLRELARRGYTQGLENVLMTQGERTTAGWLARHGLVERGLFDGIGRGIVYRISDAGQRSFDALCEQEKMGL